MNIGLKMQTGRKPNLEHEPEKWAPVFHATNAERLRADHAQTKR
jgi:hypothetical protein